MIKVCLLFLLYLLFQAKSQFKRRSTANNVEIIIPVPSDADSPKFKTSIGSVKYTPEQSAFVWNIKSFPGDFTIVNNFRSEYLFSKRLFIAISATIVLFFCF